MGKICDKFPNTICASNSFLFFVWFIFYLFILILRYASWLAGESFHIERVWKLVTLWQHSVTEQPNNTGFTWPSVILTCVTCDKLWKTAKQHKYTLALITDTQTFTTTLMLIFKLDSDTGTMFSSVWIDMSLTFCLTCLKRCVPFIGKCTIVPARDAPDLKWHKKEMTWKAE